MLINHTPVISNNRGFTLIELAIVLVIIGVLVGSFIGTVGSRIDTTRRAEAISDLDDIKQAILGYAYSSAGPNLPCPDCNITAGCIGGTKNDGLEDRRITGICYTDTGNVPWATLGLGRSDVWNTRYLYWVDTAFANLSPSFDLSSGATGIIQTRVPDGGGGTTLENVATNAAMVVLTYGKNTYGGTTADNSSTPAIPAGNVDEAENADGDSTFISRESTLVGASTAGGEFDDILIWLPEYELKAKMVELGLLP